MKHTAATVKNRLSAIAAEGNAIRFRRVKPDLVKGSEWLLPADLALMDHSSGVQEFPPAAELLPVSNGNEQLLCNARRYSDFIAANPVIAGVCGTDPFRIPEKLLEQVAENGFVGVQNWPSIGLIDGEFRQHLENSRISFVQELATLKLAKHVGLLAVATVFSVEDAQAAIAVGADILVVHAGPKALAQDAAETATAQLIAAVKKAANADTNPIILPWPS